MKDPAFLFYSNDFLSGTYTMSDEQVGKYIRLLCLQHQKYTLTEKDMLNICKTYDEDIFCKFVNSEAGYYNQKLREVSEKRKSYSESRRNNRKSTKKDEHMNNICKTYDKHMENENENENINDIGNYINYRKIEFSKYPENFRQRLESEFMVTSPIVYTTDRANDQYKDFTEIIYTAITDEPWIMQLSRTNKPDKIRQRLTDFINYNLQSQNFRNSKYLSKNEFQQHFVNKYLK